MPRLDRYLLAQLMGLFGFFALVLVSIYWLNRAVLLFDQLISDGQSAMVVFEFTALSLPYVIRVVLPIAAFAATIYAINKLSSESELVVMQAIGASPWRLGRPVLMFGAIVGVMMIATGGVALAWRNFARSPIGCLFPGISLAIVIRMSLGLSLSSLIALTLPTRIPR